MPQTDELSQLLRQRTWDKELNLWVGPERQLRPLLDGLKVETLDLLDVIDDDWPVEDEDIRRPFAQAIRQRLKAIPRERGQRLVVVAEIDDVRGRDVDGWSAYLPGAVDVQIAEHWRITRTSDRFGNAQPQRVSGRSWRVACHAPLSCPVPRRWKTRDPLPSPRRGDGALSRAPSLVFVEL